MPAPDEKATAPQPSSRPRVFRAAFWSCLFCLLCLGPAACAPEREYDAAALAQWKNGGLCPEARAARSRRDHQRALREALEAEQVYVDMVAELAMGLYGPITPGAVLEAVRPLLGAPYLWGGVTAQGLDCSGFTRLVMRKLGVQLPRTSRQQATRGVPVSPDVLQPGDLVFFAVDKKNVIDHVAIMVGPNRMAHSTSRRGRVVIEPFKGSYPGKFAGARRVVGRK